jgi:hypothetical protein
MSAEGGEKQFDYAKTKHFAHFDIVVKVITALGVLGLGIAGILFQNVQRNTTEALARQEAQGKAARAANERHLLTLHGLSKIELLLSEAETSFARRTYTTNEGTLMEKYGRALTTLADSLFYPEAPVIKLVPRANYGFFSATRSSNSVSVSLIAGLTLAGEALQFTGLKIVDVAEDRDGIYKAINEKLRKSPAEEKAKWLAYFDKTRGSIDMQLSENRFSSITVDERSIAAWAAWYPTNGMWVHVMHLIPAERLCENIRLEVTKIASRVIAENPQLTREYLEDRKYLDTNKRLFLPTLTAQ